MISSLVRHSKPIKYIEFIENKNSIITINNLSTSIVPIEASLSDIKNLKRKKIGPFSYYFKNSKGSKIGKYTFYITFSYDGNYNDYGSFLVNATTVINNIKTSNGYNISFNVLSSAPLNYGTSIDPIAGVILTMKVLFEKNSCTTLSQSPYPFKYQNEYLHFFSIHLRGDGIFNIIQNNF